MSKRIRSIASFLKKGVKFLFTPAMKTILRRLLAELAAPPALAFTDWDALEDDFRTFRVYCDATIDGFGATLEKEQPDGSVRSIVYVIHATLDSERH